MNTVKRSFSVKVPPQTVIPYLADFSHAEQWDPGTQKCVRTDSGPVAVGSSWANTSKIAGVSTELTYTLEGLTENQVILVGRNKTATSTETIEVRPEGSGSQVTYVNETEFKGAAKLAAPVAKLAFENIANTLVKQLTGCLNALEG